MRISDWSSDVCSSDLQQRCQDDAHAVLAGFEQARQHSDDEADQDDVEPVAASEQTFHSMPLSGGGWSRSLTGMAPAISAGRQQQPWSPWRSPLTAATALPVVSPRRLAAGCSAITLATDPVTFLPIGMCRHSLGT